MKVSIEIAAATVRFDLGEKSRLLRGREKAIVALLELLVGL
jgi:hypothetical protein